MRTKTLKMSFLLFNQIVILLLITTYAVSTLAATPTPTQNQPNTSKAMLLAKGQAYVPPKKDRDNYNCYCDCA